MAKVKDKHISLYLTTQVLPLYTHSSILLHPIQSATRSTYRGCFQVTVMYAMPLITIQIHLLVHTILAMWLWVHLHMFKSTYWYTIHGPLVHL